MLPQFDLKKYRRLQLLRILIYVIAIGGVMTACSNCVIDVDSENHQIEVSCTDADCSTSNAYPDSFIPRDDKYPYAGLPRIVIETENRQTVKSRTTDVSAKMQIWGESAAESDLMELTIRGRGNSSWDMPKKSYKIELAKKQVMLGMPKDKDWALIANYADKSLMRNYISYRLSSALNAYYAPRCEFAELYLNGEYLGVYLLTETIKIGKNRVNIPQNDESYIVEVDKKYKETEQVVFSDILKNDTNGKPFRIHDPKNASEAVLDTIQNHIQNFEKFLKTIKSGKKNDIEDWLDIEESVMHYWVQELTKNPDAEFYSSVYFSWIKGKLIRMGPVWDFDLAFGNHINANINLSDGWHIRTKYWNNYLFKSDEYVERVNQFWNEKRDEFIAVLDSIDNQGAFLSKAAKNNFKRWEVLKDTSSSLWKDKAFSTYDDAVSSLKNWLSKRIQWIDEQLDN